MKCNYILSKRLLISLVFMMVFSNTWVGADTNLCVNDAQILNQSDSDSEEEKTQESSEDEEEDEEPECD